MCAVGFLLCFFNFDHFYCLFVTVSVVAVPVVDVECRCFLLILFHVMGLVLRRRNGTENNTLLLA